ncbi:MAG: phage portal protein [Acidimicrobiales bacterium]
MLGRLIGTAAAVRSEARAATADEALAALIAQRSGSSAKVFPVTPSTAFAHDAVWASVRAISNPIMVAPVSVHRGDELSAKATPATQIRTPRIVADPASSWEIDREAALTFAVDSLLLWGNLFGEVTELDANGWPAQVRPVHPGLIQWRMDRTGRVSWYLEGRGEVRKWPNGTLWHRALYPSSGPVGVPAIYWGAKQIGLGLAAQEAASDWFANGSQPSGVLSSAKSFENEADVDAAKVAKEKLRAAIRDREPVAIGGDWTYQAIQIPPDQAQFLETIGANVATVARLFGVRPERIGGSAQGGASLTYANLEQSELSHITQAVNPVRWCCAGRSRRCFPVASSWRSDSRTPPCSAP